MQSDYTVCVYCVH